MMQMTNELASQTEYPKIETLYERDETTHKIKVPYTLKNPAYGLIRAWDFTEKIDGMNMRISWHPSLGLGVAGRTAKAQIPDDLLAWIEQNVTTEKMQSIFPDQPLVLYGEGYGAGIQKGGGLYSPEKRFILFDVLVKTENNFWWLRKDDIEDVARKLRIESVPYLGTFPLDYMAGYVRDGFASRLNPEKQAEGVVGRPSETLYDARGKRLILKLKTKDF